MCGAQGVSLCSEGKLNGGDGIGGCFMGDVEYVSVEARVGKMTADGVVEA